MKKSIILLVLLFGVNVGIKAQKFEISYGNIMGLNTSYINAELKLDSYYPFNKLDRNFNLYNTYETKIGYDLGIFFHIKPTESRFNLESGIILSKYSNNYTVSLGYDAYYSVSSIDSWMSENVNEKVTNNFTVINIPVIVGYDIIEFNKINITLQSGLIFNINMDNDHTITDINMEEHPLYKDYFTGYTGGFRINYGKIICQCRYSRTFDIMEATSRDYFPWEINVDKLNLNSFSITFGYLFN